MKLICLARQVFRNRRRPEFWHTGLKLVTGHTFVRVEPSWDSPIQPPLELYRCTMCGQGEVRFRSDV